MDDGRWIAVGLANGHCYKEVRSSMSIGYRLPDDPFMTMERGLEQSFMSNVSRICLLTESPTTNQLCTQK